jgi:hypothetical protein
MQSELIYIPNTKVFALEKYGSYFTINLPEGRNIIKNIERIGSPFSIITKKKVDKINLLEYNQEFKELANPTPASGTLVYYLTNANVDITLSTREETFIQYLGITYGKTTIIDIITKMGNPESKIVKYIVPCHFYLIKDKNLNGFF